MAPVTRSHVSSAQGPGAQRTDQPFPFDPHGSNSGARDVSDDDDDGEEDSDEDDDDDDDEGPVRSPLTNLFYDIDGLDDETQELVRELFRPPAPDETPPVVIEWCGISNDPDVYAFQLQEIVPRTIRIGSATSRIPHPSCNCTGSEDKPCRHLVWLMDQIASQTMAHGHDDNSTAAEDGDHDRPLVLDPKTAFPRELGNAYARIADFHIGVLANTLHCRAGPPNGRPDSHRVREAREILAGLQGVQDDATVDAYAPEIFDLEKSELERLLWSAEEKPHPVAAAAEAHDSEEEEDDDDDGDDDRQELDRDTPSQGHDRETAYEEGSERSRDEEPDGAELPTAEGEPLGEEPGGCRPVRDLVERGDLQRTVLRLLVSNDEFFAMFLKLLAPQDKARDPFRKIQQRVEAVLQALRAARTAGEPRQSAAGEAISVAWAAKHVQSAVRQIRHLLARAAAGRTEPWAWAWARASAARAILCIMTALVSKHTRDAHAGTTQNDRNLYQCLIGNSGTSASGDIADTGDVLLDALDAVHDQVQFLSQVERIRRRIQRSGYREPYMQRLDAILARMRAIRDGGGGARPHVVAGSKRPMPPGGPSAERKPKRTRQI